jgi:hypothetical protein
VTSNIVYCYYIEGTISERTLPVYGVRGSPASPAPNSSNWEPDVSCGEFVAGDPVEICGRWVR